MLNDTFYAHGQPNGNGDPVLDLARYIAEIAPHSRLKTDQHIDLIVRLFASEQRRGIMISGTHLLRDQIELERRAGFEQHLTTLDALLERAGIPPRKGRNIYGVKPAL